MVDTYKFNGNLGRHVLSIIASNDILSETHMFNTPKILSSGGDTYWRRRKFTFIFGEDHKKLSSIVLFNQWATSVNQTPFIKLDWN